ncbi:polysaccharide deacetylase family protein [Streptomyces sp. CC77]|uniref:polysaccharide deacetylase family protein n=1 Tax=Streptomyces sp. CC77 TaxID=1906739 RepID=UPI0008DD30FB|nr:polysaccharide deacetylase family protein [Streptomyces sp. CC77]OII63361.1 hydrolase [Streptomyces sp. CC77]
MSRPRMRGTLRAVLAVLVPLVFLTGFTPWPQPVPVVSRIDTDEPVVFLTIDDGWHHDPAAARLLLDRRVPASLFVLPGAYAYDSAYFQSLLAHGPSRIENHTVNHPDLTVLDGPAQRAEICGARDRHLAQFGAGPRLFRPPYGTYDEETRSAARACGAKALVTWTHDLTPWGGGTPAPTPELKAGDIVLLHFTENLAADLARVLAAADAAGLEPAQLRDYVTE